MAYLLLTFQVVFATILLLAATGKWLNMEQFLSSLRLSGIPKTLITPVAIFTPLLEICLALSLLLGPSEVLPLVIIATIGLVGAFTIWMSVVFARGLRVQCGCFGTASSIIGPHTIVRNILLIVALLCSFILSRLTTSPLPTLSLWVLMTISSLGMCLILLRTFQSSRSFLFLSMAELRHFQEKEKASEISS